MFFLFYVKRKVTTVIAISDVLSRYQQLVLRVTECIRWQDWGIYSRIPLITFTAKRRQNFEKYIEYLLVFWLSELVCVEMIN